MEKRLSKKACKYLADKLARMEKLRKVEPEHNRESCSNSSLNTLDQSCLKYRTMSRGTIQSLSCSKKKKAQRSLKIGEESLRLPDRYEDALKIYSNDRRSMSNHHKTMFYKGLTFDKKSSKKKIGSRGYSAVFGMSSEFQTNSFSSGLNPFIRDSSNHLFE